MTASVRLGESQKTYWESVASAWSLKAVLTEPVWPVTAGEPVGDLQRALAEQTSCRMTVY
ncbi:hypothetical protein Enr13x_34430 [Stieleria neptunia]|uniref:Uncharacterized protein n=1 Tax=Stieleria neptunia TaxID=2527979 RepID=A0A518HRW3_9BACT|nr:hypothetical protein Enr13x_34430 [Stieleria neptunia]